MSASLQGQVDELTQQVRHLTSLVTFAFGLGRVMAPAAEAGVVQTLQVAFQTGELIDGMPSVQSYGFAASLKPGADVATITLSGTRLKCFAIASNDQRYRPKNMANGEVMVFDDQGQRVYITRNGIVIDGAGKQVTIQNTPEVLATTPTFKIDGELQVTQNILCVKDVLANDCIANAGGATSVSLFNHQHGNGNGGADTTPPLAV